ncbi:hypothetical protein [Microbacterium sp. 77mftsu3.1]|uniref:hypothetical protein n=1 Tax=Microbacterium sp. 77mftsu3.1 TaxID=1761802 RepID=UPI00037F4BC9|nr:hypothetical protein [Microbacterium sp. 77mftsu3.1]SDG22087.1 hypothetical protein SAMN04488590_0226 [Microbacterium sp. 77mftsu3.1]
MPIAWHLYSRIVLAFLAALVPTITSLGVAVWYLTDAISHRALRRRRYELSEKLEEASAASRRRNDPNLNMDQRMKDLAEEQNRLRREAGLPAGLSIRDHQIDAELGRALPVAEIVRQLVLIGGAVAGIILLAADTAAA